MQEAFGISERRVCRAIEQPRSSQRYAPRKPNRDEPLTKRIVDLAVRYGRYGYRRITALLRLEGWWINHKKVERTLAPAASAGVWRSEGLKVPQRQPKRGRLWLNDGSCIRLRPERPNHVWSYDFVMDTTDDGRPFRMMNVIDEYTRQCLAIRVSRKLCREPVQRCRSAGERDARRGHLGHARGLHSLAGVGSVRRGVVRLEA